MIDSLFAPAHRRSVSFAAPPAKISKTSQDMKTQVTTVSEENGTNVHIRYRIVSAGNQVSATIQNGPMSPSSTMLTPPPFHKMDVTRSDDAPVPWPPVVTPPIEETVEEAMSMSDVVVEEHVELPAGQADKLTGTGGDMLCDLLVSL